MRTHAVYPSLTRLVAPAHNLDVINFMKTVSGAELAVALLPVFIYLAGRCVISACAATLEKRSWGFGIFKYVDQPPS